MPPRSPLTRLIDFMTPAGLVVFLLGVLIFTYFFSTQLYLNIDDAYITYRFADRLAEEGTLRWNLAPVPDDIDIASETRAMLERPVEGYSSFLAVIISTVFIKMGFDPVVAWRFYGIVFAIVGAAAIVIGAHAWLRRWGKDSTLTRVSPCLLGALHLFYPLTAMHAASGMETMLFSCLLLILAAIALQIPLNLESKKLPIAFAIFGLLLGMTRPDGVLWFTLVSIAVFFSLPDGGLFRAPSRKRLTASLIFGFVIPGAGYFLWRVWYFHSLLPATFHAKSAGPERPSPLGRLYTYLPSHWELWQYIRDLWLPFFILLPIFLILFLKTRSKSESKDHHAARPAIAIGGMLIASCLCLAYYARVHLLMGFGWRFFYPYGQTLILALLLPLFTFIALCDRRKLRLALASALIIAFAWSGLKVLTKTLGCCSTAPSMMPRTEYEVHPYIALSKAFGYIANRADRQLLVYHHNVGELFYHAPRLDTIDPVGLVDLPMAVKGFSPELAMKRKPDILLLPSRSISEVTPYNYVFGTARVEIFPDISKSILDYGNTRSLYTNLGCYTQFKTTADGGGFHVLLRNDLLAEHPDIIEQLDTMLSLVPVPEE